MASGLNLNTILIERFLGSVATGNLSQTFAAPCDLDVIGLVATVGTAAGSSDAITVNINNSPTSQLSKVSAFNLWTATNVPTITDPSKTSYTTSATTAVVQNRPYPLNYPLPGPTGTVGYTTAQATSQTTETPVVSPPTIFEYQMGALVQPDNTYTDYNGVALTSAARINAGDVLTFVVGGTAGSAANLSIVLYTQKR